MKEKTKRPLLRGRYLAVALTAAAVYVGCPFRLEVVRGDSMNPTLHNGSVCVLDRTYYAAHPIERGDIIAFRLDDAVLTKRVYGAPGEKIELVKFPNDGTYILPPPGTLGKLRRFSRLSWMHAPTAPYLTMLSVPPGACFVLGDNAPASYDSRQFGLVPTTAIIGKMVTGIR